ncbi:lipase family protein [Streptomyces anulatus]|uniref:lipase family protein n=1 Tax=Streptomyces anulatus TaxID=1892 RepID=UPI003F4DA097
MCGSPATASAALSRCSPAAGSTSKPPRLQADGIYTFGQPRTCDRLLAASCNKSFKDRLHCYVNNNDVVSQLPPEPVYTHVDTLHYIDSTSCIRSAMPALATLGDRLKGATADLLAPVGDGLRDHSITRYITAMEKNLI